MRRSVPIAHEEGFTLVETMMATAIGALLLGTLGIAIYQFSAITRLHSGSLTLSQQMQSAATTLNRDLVGAASGVVTDDDALTLYVPSYAFGELADPVTYTVSYVVDGDTLVRTADDDALVVARHVSDVSFGEPGPIGSTVEVVMTVATEGHERSTTLQFHRRPGP